MNMFASLSGSKILFGSLLAMSVAGCGQVDRDAAPGGQNPPGQNPPGQNPPGQNPPVQNPPVAPKSAVCASASIDDAKAVAIWTTHEQELVFVRHDGSEFVAHDFDPIVGNGLAAVRKGGERIVALASESWQTQRAELVLFDRFGKKLASLSVNHS